MKKFFSATSLLLLLSDLQAQNRFPRPDFKSGYQYPDHAYHVPAENLWEMVDIFVLVLLMSIVAWAVIKKRTRKPVIFTSVISVAYFGFFRSGCVCSIGSIQNISLALVDNTYLLPVSVFLFFILPILFAFLFGRVFCAGVCPFGALQELVNVRHYRLSQSVTTILSIFPWIYLVFAILYAITRSSFIICRFDPFIGIFRLGGDFGMISFGVLLLIASVFTGRPFCRFICPYGALLSLFSRFSIWNIRITNQKCINCELCHNACPIDAIKPPYDNKTKESRQQGVKRVLLYFLILPLLILSAAALMRMSSNNLSRAHKDVRLYESVMQQESSPQEILSPELEAFYSKGESIEQLKQKYETIQADYKLFTPFAGALIGLVIGLSLIRLSVKRTRKEYQIDYADCVDCGRCLNYCPQNKIGFTSDKLPL